MDHRSGSQQPGDGGGAWREGGGGLRELLVPEKLTVVPLVTPLRVTLWFSCTGFAVPLGPAPDCMALCALCPVGARGLDAHRPRGPVALRGLRLAPPEAPFQREVLGTF